MNRKIMSIRRKPVISSIFLALLVISYMFGLSGIISNIITELCLVIGIVMYRYDENIKEILQNIWQEGKIFLLLIMGIAVTFSISIWGNEIGGESFHFLKQYIQYLLFPIFAISFLGSLCKNPEIWIKRVIAIAIIILTIVLLYQAIVLHMNRPYAWYGINNVVNWLACMIGMFLFLYMAKDKNVNRKDELLYGCMALCAGISLVLIKSRGAFLGVTVALSFFCIYCGIYYFKHKVQICSIMRNVLFVIGIIVGLLLPMQQQSMINRLQQTTHSVQNVQISTSQETIKPKNTKSHDVDRIYLWQAAITMIKEHPIIGVGFQNFNHTYVQNPEMSKKISNHTLQSPHNVVLHVWAETGSLGLIAYLAFNIYTVYYIISTSKYNRLLALSLECGIIVMLVHSIVDYAVLQKVISQIISMYIGLCIVQRIKNNDKGENR